MLEPTDSGVQNRWRALWESSPQRSPFSRLEYVRSAADAAGFRVGIHFVPSSGNDAAGAALTWRRLGPYTEVLVPPFTPFTALLTAAPQSDADVHARRAPLEQLLADIEPSYDAVRVSLPPAFADIRTAQWRGWKAEPLYTYCLDLSDYDPSAWSKGTSRLFRAERDQYDVVEGQAAADAAVRLATASYRRHGRSPRLDEASLASLVAGLIEHGLAVPVAVRRRETGSVDAAVVVIRAESRAYYWLAGSLPGAAMTVLIGEILPRLVRSGIESFDFVGANTPTIAEFKRHFGGTLIPYFRLVRFARIDLKLLYMFRKMWR